MNLPFGVPALAGPSRLKAGLRTDCTPSKGKWPVPPDSDYMVPALAGTDRLKAKLQTGDAVTQQEMRAFRASTQLV